MDQPTISAIEKLSRLMSEVMLPEELEADELCDIAGFIGGQRPNPAAAFLFKTLVGFVASKWATPEILDSAWKRLFGNELERIDAPEQPLDIVKRWLADLNAPPEEATVRELERVIPVADSLPPEVWVALSGAVCGIDGAEAALPYVERALRIDPTNVAALNRSAFLHKHAGNPQKALDFANRAVRAAPELPDGYQALSYIHIHNGDLTDALEANGAALAVAEGKARKVIQTNRGLILHDLDRCHEAVNAFRSGLRADECEIEQLAPWGRCLGRTGAWLECRTVLDVAIEKVSGDEERLASFLAQRATAEEGLGDIAAAERDYAKALQVVNGGGKGYVESLYGAYLDRAGRLEEAEAMYSVSLSKMKTHEIYSIRADLRERLGKLRAALSDWEAAGALGPGEQRTRSQARIAELRNVIASHGKDEESEVESEPRLVREHWFLDSAGIGVFANLGVDETLELETRHTQALSKVPESAPNWVGDQLGRPLDYVVSLSSPMEVLLEGAPVTREMFAKLKHKSEVDGQSVESMRARAPRLGEGTLFLYRDQFFFTSRSQDSISKELFNVLSEESGPETES